MRFNSAEDIRAELDNEVIGQESAKKSLSLLLSMHLRWPSSSDLRHPSPNALVMGPTGSGKTHTIQTASRILGIPFVSVDSTNLVPAGYRGASLEDLISGLVIDSQKIYSERKKEASKIEKKEINQTSSKTSTKSKIRFDADIFDDLDLNSELEISKIAETGIIFFDEFDKLAAREGFTENIAYRLEAQRTLLKFVEGKKVEVKGHTIDTKGILVIAGGAYQGIKDTKIRSLRSPKIREHLVKKRSQDSVISTDIISYGFIPELVARLPILISFEELGIGALISILNNHNVSPLQIWKNHFNSLGKNLTFSDKFLEGVAVQASKLDLGARGLQQVIFPILTEATYEFESSAEKTLNIDDSYII